MDIDVEQPAEQPSVAVLRLRGRLDMLSAGSVRERLREVVAGGRHHLVVDLSGVSFVDSSGLSALISGLKQSRQAGGDLRLVNPAQQARLVLQVTALDRVMRPYGSVSEAAAGL